MSILSTNKRLIKVGQDYSAGSGISIDDYVISVTGEFGKTYSAGENITIEDNVINSKDWSQDIADASANAYNEATAQIPEPFDPSYISAKVDDKLDATAFTTWQDGQYTTDLQTIEGQINNKLDTTAFSDVSASFLTAINIPESATWNEVSQAYEQASGTYLTSVSIPESATWQDVSTTVQSNSAQWSDNTGDEEVNSFVYDNSATINDVNSSYQTNSGNFLTALPEDLVYTDDLSGYLSTSSTGGFRTKANISVASSGTGQLGFPNEYTILSQNSLIFTSAKFIPPTQIQVDAGSVNNWNSNYNTVTSNSSNWNDITAYQTNSANYLTAHQSLDGYATTAEVDTLSSMLSGAIDYVSANAGDQEVSNVVQSNSGNWNTVSDKLDTTAFSTVSGDFLTAHQSLDGYATEDWVTAQGYVTGVDLSEYAKTSSVLDYIDSACSSKLDTTSFSNVSGDFLTTSFGISESAHWEESTNAYEQNSGTYLTAHQDLSDYQTIEGMTAYQPVGSYATTNDLEQVSSDLISVSSTVNSNSASWGTGVTYTSPSGTIFISDDKIESTNSAVVYGIAWQDWVRNPGNYPNGWSIKYKPGYPYDKVYAAIGMNGDSSGELTAYYENSLSAQFTFTSGDWHVAMNSKEIGHLSGYPLQCVKWSGNNYVRLSGFSGRVFELASVDSLTYKQDVLTFGYNDFNEISAINGSAIAAGDEFPASANEAITAYQNASGTYLTAISIPESATWNDVSTTVQTNSASWGQGGGGVPQSAFDELKQSYDTLSSLFATYSGQWLLPNEPAVQYVLSSMTANVEINDGSWDHGGDVGFSIPQEVSAFTLGLEQGKLSAIFNLTEAPGKNGDKVRYSYNKYNIPDDDFCGRWFANGSTSVTALLSGFGENSASPTGYPVYMGFPYMYRDAGMYNPVTFSGYVPVQQGV